MSAGGLDPRRLYGLQMAALCNDDVWPPWRRCDLVRPSRQDARYDSAVQKEERMRVRTVNVSIELLTDVSLKTLGDRHAWSVFENGYDITRSEEHTSEL